MKDREVGPGIVLRGPVVAFEREVLTPEALAFVAGLQRQFGAERARLLERRRELDQRLADGWRPDFLEETAAVRAGDWRVAPVPEEIQDRRVEITGPVDRKMVINALNSGAQVFMADFEDSSAPTWANVISGQINLADAVCRRIHHFDPGSGKEYRLADDPAVLFVRPRGWHLDENHLLVDGAPVSGSLLDFGLFFFHNAKQQLARGTGPYFYLPKMESHLEARLWDQVFRAAQQQLGIPVGTIKATVLIETILAAFEMDEILHELREHSAGLNCGRWDYIFSFIKKFRHDPAFVVPDRASVGMDRDFLRAYSRLLIQTCHRRGAHAMGGMAAQIPIKGDAAANDQALAKVRADKEREATDGHDGTWVAHPALVGLAREVFDRLMPGPNQLDQGAEVEVSAADLLAVPTGKITEAGLRQNVNVGVLYLEAWLRGTGCVPLYHLMEDAATAEISRAQVWQWVRHGARLDDGRVVDAALFTQVLREETAAIAGDPKLGGPALEQASELFGQMVQAEDFEEFLTLPAYRMLASDEPDAPSLSARHLRPGVVLVEPRCYGDPRGFFMETYQKSRFAAFGITLEFCQENHSRSAQGVLRGLHYQIEPREQGKLVRVPRGAVYDVAVDIRASSPTFGEKIGWRLDEDNHYLLWVPPGFAHGFVALEDDTDFVYLVTKDYSKDHERGVHYRDPDLAIDWPDLPLKVKQVDEDWPRLKDAPKFP